MRPDCSNGLSDASALVSDMISDYIYFVSLGSNGSFEIEWLKESYFSSSPCTKEDIIISGAGRYFGENSDKYFPLLSKSLRENIPHSSEIKVKNEDGKILWFRDMIVPYPVHEEGTAPGVYIFGMEITDIKKTESALSESEQRFREIAELLPVFIYETDNNANITYTNRHSFELTGYRPADLQNGLTIFDLVVSEDHERLKQNVEKLYENYFSNGNEYTLRKKNGEIINVLNYSRTIMEKGIITGIRGSLADITHQKDLQKELGSAYSKLEQIFNSGLPMCVIGLDYHIVNVNEPFEQITGKSKRDIIGKHCSEILSNEMCNEADCSINKVLLTGEANETVFKINSKGTDRIFVVTSKPFFTNDKKIIGIVKSFIDVTEKLTAEKLKEESLLATLEAEKKRSEALVLVHNSTYLASIGAIARSIIHEISQPLSAIRVGADSILIWDKENNHVHPSITIKVIEHIVHATERITDIVQHIRAILINSQNEETGIIGLNATIKKALGYMDNQIRRHEIYLKSELEQDEVNIQANAFQLEIVLNNLVSNAIHSIEQKKSRERFINLSTHSDEEFAYLKIEDNGIGLPDVPVDKLFDPFFSTNSLSEGAGFGLAIVDAFLKRFDATIEAANLEGGGAVFTLKFKKSRQP